MSPSASRTTWPFFRSIAGEDRSVLDLMTADYTFVNERLARHYGIPDVYGEAFRKVSYPDERRAGIFGHGSVLVLTSHADRTSPVLRGKWVMEVLMNMPLIADTRPRMRSGVSICTSVWRMMTLTESNAPIASSQAKPRAKEVASPTIIQPNSGRIDSSVSSGGRPGSLKTSKTL